MNEIEQLFLRNRICYGQREIWLLSLASLSFTFRRIDRWLFVKMRIWHRIQDHFGRPFLTSACFFIFIINRVFERVCCFINFSLNLQSGGWLLPANFFHRYHHLYYYQKQTHYFIESIANFSTIPNYPVSTLYLFNFLSRNC